MLLLLAHKNQTDARHDQGILDINMVFPLLSFFIYLIFNKDNQNLLHVNSYLIYFFTLRTFVVYERDNQTFSDPQSDTCL